jgi:hypothetical protein
MPHYEAKIILPMRDNDGAPLEVIHEMLAKALCLGFGRCTITKGEGLWLDGGKFYQEEVAVFHVAGQALASDRLADIARRFGSMAKQLAVYYVDFKGKVHIDDLPQASPAIAA